MPRRLDDMDFLKDRHSLNVITSLADAQVYIALKHAITIVGYNTEVYLPVISEGTPDFPIAERTPQLDGSIYSGMPLEGAYNQEDRTGSIYNDKDHKYRYNEDPDFIARIAFLDPQAQPVTRGTEMFLNEENTAYTLQNTSGHRNYCPGEILLHSRLLVHYGNEDLSYFVRDINVLRNPNARNHTDESLIYLDLCVHM